jgi:hypothetical protein
MINVYVDAIGLAAPGLPNWNESQSILRGETIYESVELEKYKPEQLPPNERRRATELVRMAFRVCEDMMKNSSVDMAQCESVVASYGGDHPIIDQICSALCEPERQLSPTQFHNSVHNSAAGYWSIATASRLPSTSISAYDDSFCGGLLEAASFCHLERMNTILAVYDIKTPPPLNTKRNISAEFGAAFLLTPEMSEHSLAKLSLTLVETDAPTKAIQNELEVLRFRNPAARALPLLEIIASKKSGTVDLLNDNKLAVRIEITPCNLTIER